MQMRSESIGKSGQAKGRQNERSESQKCFCGCIRNPRPFPRLRRIQPDHALPHRNGSSAYIFNKFAARCADQFRVLTLNRRGQGDSDYPETGYDEYRQSDTAVSQVKS